MKNPIALLAALLLAVGTANAGFYSDNNPADVYLNYFNPSYTGEFTLAGYNPAAETVTSAYAEFTLFDLLGRESLKVTMYGDTFASNGNFSGWLFKGGYIDTGWTAWATLDATGALTYTVTNTGLSSNVLSEFWLSNARLDVETGPRNVPDAGATAILLGLGVALVVGARRRFSPVH